MLKTSLIATVPVLYNKESVGILEELCQQSRSISLPFDEFGIVIPTIKLLDWIDRHGLKKPLEIFGKIKILEIGCNVPISGENLTGVTSEGSEIVFDHEQSVNVRRSTAASLFEKRINDLILAANLAQPNKVQVYEGTILQDSEFWKMQFVDVDALFLATKISTQLGWPQIESLKFSDVWSWLLKQQGFLMGFGSGKVVRALNALANIVSVDQQNFCMNLFWAMMGIEALYCIGNKDLSEQVREKSQIFLGEIESYKKRLKQMYQFRSRFIHGDIDFPGPIVVCDGTDGLDKYYDELHESAGLAIAILVSTIQQLINRGWDSLIFETHYTVSEGI